jgi:hypothetical protein
MLRLSAVLVTMAALLPRASVAEVKNTRRETGVAFEELGRDFLA